MARTTWSLVALGLMIGIARDAKSADLVTSLVNCGTRYFGCFAVNTGNKSVDLTVESSGIQTAITLMPGEFYTPSNPCPPGGIGYCRFMGARKATLRGSYCVAASPGGPCEVVGDAR